MLCVVRHKKIMIYYVIRDGEGYYYNGGDKLCSPPLMCFVKDVNFAHVYRIKAQAKNKILKSKNGEYCVVDELISSNHPRLAD